MRRPGNVQLNEDCTGEAGWSWLEFVRAHRRASTLGLAAVLAAIAVIVASVVLSSHPGALSDATPCSEWAIASTAGQEAYARLYLSEFGGLTRAGSTPAAVRATITGACDQAALLAEADEVTVVAAVHRRY